MLILLESCKQRLHFRDPLRDRAALHRFHKTPPAARSIFPASPWCKDWAARLGSAPMAGRSLAIGAHSVAPVSAFGISRLPRRESPSEKHVGRTVDDS